MAAQQVPLSELFRGLDTVAGIALP